MRPFNPTLLVIEDTRDHAELVGFVAERIHPGLDVRIANDGLEGISYLAGLPPFDDRLAHPRPDLIILDLYMPEVDGFEVLQWIGERPEPLHIPVVVLTAALTEENALRCRDLGAIAAFRKPKDIDGLARTVRDIVEMWIGSSAIIGAHLWAAG